MVKKLTELRTAIGLALAALFLYLALDAIFDLPPTALEFHAETVRAIPNGERVRFIGDYTFIPHHARRYSYDLGYPTQNDSSLPSPAEVVVKVDERDVPFRVLSQGLDFRLPVQPNRETHLHIEYTMAAPNHRATYIARTAILWPKPITEARFVLPQGATSNYHQANTTETLLKDFRPREDWVIQW